MNATVAYVGADAVTKDRPREGWYVDGLWGFPGGPFRSHEAAQHAAQHLSDVLNRPPVPKFEETSEWKFWLIPLAILAALVIGATLSSFGHGWRMRDITLYLTYFALFLTFVICGFDQMDGGGGFVTFIAVAILFGGPFLVRYVVAA